MPRRKTPNSFIIYRKEKQKWLRENYPGISQRALSKKISQMWAYESPHIRGRYESMSLMLSINNIDRHNPINRQYVGPTNYENGTTHFFVIENVVQPNPSVVNEVTDDDDYEKFLDSIINFDP
ncbi:9710_t:CDS:1 [Scutellospora calospora]|uniref:9710_t:CDS:1 n=1 Tax=Scutellospora calospora TaxID=85575 RepID=A0ACA9LHL4_9GLOM|nr:9710_t:CDS:1 [Scutellospora calospora]